MNADWGLGWWGYLIFRSSTSKTRVALGGMTPAAASDTDIGIFGCFVSFGDVAVDSCCNREEMHGNEHCALSRNSPTTSRTFQLAKIN